MMLDMFASSLGGEALMEMGKFVHAFAKWSISIDALNASGWLPFHSASTKSIVKYQSDTTQLDRYFSEYYQTHWNSIRDEMKSSLDSYRIDDEARATFCEAIEVHEHGLYRCVCRVLLPEVQRVIGGGSRSKDSRDKFAGIQSLEDLVFKRHWDYVIFGQPVSSVYESGKIGYFKDNPVPNRHAAEHGVASYSTHKHSMNMLIFTDYIFRSLPSEIGSD